MIDFHIIRYFKNQSFSGHVLTDVWGVRAPNSANKCVRSNHSVNVRAFIDRKAGKVICNSKIAYRVYPTKERYSDIKVGFYEKESESTCGEVIINTPHGEREVKKGKDLTFGGVVIDGGKARLANIDVSKYNENCSHLDIEMNITEPGYDHWKMLSFGALLPTDGFRHYIRCEDGLEIRDFHTFVHGAKMHVDLRDNNEMTTSCNEWVNEGTGLSVLISLPDAHTRTSAGELAQQKNTADG